MFNCDQCGLCCKKVGITEQYKHLDRGDGVCLHFDISTNLCGIYEDRPVICRVDESYDLFYKDKMSQQEFYYLNYKACDALKGMELQKMSDLKSTLEDKFEELFGYRPWNGDEKQVRNALEIICQGKPEKDEIIAIIDTSISTNGKSGMVLTLDSVYIKDAGNSTSKFIAKYEDIESTYIKEDKFLGVDITALELNMQYGTQYRISIDKISRRKLMEYLDYASSLYQEDDKLEW
ncbi:YkgJ family cysteine cluster protein [Paenibacillus sp. PAMC21692]|nr:YkgJ family cysteine cluster protein [Paenibacillus sp. PAMC21692]